MKPILTFTILLLSLTTNAQKTLMQLEHEKMVHNKKIKSVIISSTGRFTSKSEKEEKKEGLNYEVKYMTEYDKYGNLLKELSFYDKKIIFSTINTYDILGNLIETIVKGNNDSIISKNINTYNENKLTETKLIQYSSATTQIWAFNDSNRIISESMMRDEKLMYKNEYSYQDDTLLVTQIKIYYLANNEEYYSKIVFEYDKSFNLISKLEYDKLGKLISKDKVSRKSINKAQNKNSPEFKNNKLMKEYTCDGETCIIHKYEYNEKGLVSKETITDGFKINLKNHSLAPKKIFLIGSNPLPFSENTKEIYFTYNEENVPISAIINDINAQGPWVTHAHFLFEYTNWE